MNTYVKYCPNVFVAKCTERHEKGETIVVTTQYGKEHECIVFNCLGFKDGFSFYSIVRADGYNVQERAKQKAERYQKWSTSAVNKSNEYYEAANEGKDFLSLGEPIKIGHHSEKRHRALFERNDNRMRKSIEQLDKSASHDSKAEYWNSRANEINLSMPESVEYFEYRLEEAKEKHEGLKSGEIERSHSFSLTYAKKEVNELQKKFDLAKKLWS